MPVNNAEVLAYVKAAAAMLELPLDEARAQAVALQLARTHAMAAQLEQLHMPFEEESSAVFCPAPFPALTAAPVHEADAQQGPA